MPKYSNYILDENCPVFKKIKNVEKLEKFKYIVKKDPDKINILNNEETSPESYIKACYKMYDGKKII